MSLAGLAATLAYVLVPLAGGVALVAAKSGKLSERDIVVVVEVAAWLGGVEIGTYNRK